MNPVEELYRNCIKNKVRQCEREAGKMNGTRAHECNRPYADLMLAQAMFFDEEGDQLVQEMLMTELGMNLQRIESFLVNSFVTAFSKMGAYTRLKNSVQETSDDGNGQHPWDEASLRKMCEPVALNVHYRIDPDSFSRLLELAWGEALPLSGETD